MVKLLTWGMSFHIVVVPTGSLIPSFAAASVVNSACWTSRPTSTAPDPPLIAASRRAGVSAAQHFVPEYLVGIYQWTRPQGDITYLRFAYGGRVDGEEVGRKLDDGIVRAVWMTIDEVRATADRHRSPLILQCIEDWLAGQRFPLAVVHHA